MPTSKYISQHSFIIGQEQDEVGTYRFDYRQTTNGNLTEINLWNWTLSTKEISQLATCQSFKKVI